MSTIRAIHASARSLGLDEDSQRDLYERATGKRSLTAMTGAEHYKVLDAMRAAGAKPKPKGKAKGAMALDGPYIGKCRALWIAGFNLGIVTDRTDTAMCAFIKRQTGIDHPNWLQHFDDANRVIEALKKWLAREGGIDWSGIDPKIGLPADAVYYAQCRKLNKRPPASVAKLRLHLGAVQFQDAMNAMGEQIRTRQAEAG